MDIVSDRSKATLLFVCVLPLVLAQCPTLPVVEHATHNATGTGPFAEGVVIQFTCDIFYTTSNNRQFICKNGNFVGEMTCKKITCPYVPTPRYAKVANNPDYTVSTLLKFECYDGYDMIGDGSLLCRTDGEWKPGPPTCVPKNCGDFGHVENGREFQVTRDGILNDYGSYVTVECDYGYILDGLKNVKCTDKGTWEQKPTCVAVTCPPYPGLNSSCIHKTLLHNGILYMVCIEGRSFTQVGGDAAECMSNGQWDDTTLACYCDCKFENVSNGVVMENLNEQQNLKHKTRLNWHCEAGYERDENVPEIWCADGVAEHAPVCNKITTPVPVPTTPKSDNNDGKTDGNTGNDNKLEKKLDNNTGLIIGVVCFLVVILVLALGFALAVKLCKEKLPCFSNPRLADEENGQPLMEKKQGVRVDNETVNLVSNSADKPGPNGVVVEVGSNEDADIKKPVEGIECKPEKIESGEKPVKVTADAIEKPTEVTKDENTKDSKEVGDSDTQTSSGLPVTQPSEDK